MTSILATLQHPGKNSLLARQPGHWVQDLGEIKYINRIRIVFIDILVISTYICVRQFAYANAAYLSRSDVH